MKIQYASDLHLEFPENKKFLKEKPLQPKGDILILAGDIVLFTQMDKHKDFFKYVSDHFQVTYWVPGNHEYYYFDATKKSGTINEKIRENVFLVNNISIAHKNVRFIFSTLWSKISPEHQWQIEREMNDFHLIKYNGKRFSSEPFNQLHEESILFIKQELKENKDDKLIVVTHHVPTYMNYPEQYKGSILSDAFAVELFNVIEPSEISYWIYGHHHQNTPGFEIGSTQLITNQLGYVQQHEHQLFQTDKIIEIENV